MAENDYSQFDEDKLILRDRLAQCRTDLAHERTVLAWLRTALTFVAAGLSFVQFFNTPWIAVLGWIFVACGAVIGILTARRAVNRGQLTGRTAARRE